MDSINLLETSTEKTIDINADTNKLIIIPPPEALLQKSLFVKEEAKTGAPINFLKLQRLWGKERIEQMNAEKNGSGRFNG